jgi:hypothetical protein
VYGTVADKEDAAMPVEKLLVFLNCLSFQLVPVPM